MPSPTDFSLLSSRPKGAAVQARERLSNGAAGAADFQQLMDKSPKASSAPERDLRSRSNPRSTSHANGAGSERQSPLAREHGGPDKPARLAARESAPSRGPADSKASEPQTEAFVTDQELAEAESTSDWLQDVDSLEAFVQLDGSKELVSPDTKVLSLDQLVERLTQMLEQLDSNASEQAQQLRSVLNKIEAGVESGDWAAIIQQLSTGLAALMAEQKGLPAGNQQLVTQLQGLQKELHNIQVANTAAGVNAPSETSLDVEATSDVSWSKLATGLTESSEAALLDKGALENSGSKTANIITQLAGGEANANRIPQLQPAERGFVVHSEVRTPVGQPQWSQAVGERVLWLAAQNLTSAELRLDPPDLGPMQVRVSMNNDQVNVSFSSQQVAVREALDQGAQRLREMFNEQGLKLGDVNVSDQSEGRQFNRDRDSDGSGRRGAGAGQEDEAPPTPSQLLTMRLVDHYA